MRYGVVITEAARAHLDRLMAVLSLPEDTAERVRLSLRRLAEHPSIGGPLPPPYALQDLRFIIGPWRWFLIVYHVDEELRRVVVVALEDARSSTSVTTRTR